VRLLLEEAREEEDIARIELLLKVSNAPGIAANRTPPAGLRSGGDKQPRQQPSLSGTLSNFDESAQNKLLSALDAPGPNSVGTARSWWRSKISEPGTSSDAWHLHLL
jgi:hypothetical protein